MQHGLNWVEVPIDAEEHLPNLIDGFDPAAPLVGTRGLGTVEQRGDASNRRRDAIKEFIHDFTRGTQRRSRVGSALGDRIAGSFDNPKIAMSKREHATAREGDDEVVIVFSFAEYFCREFEPQQGGLREPPSSAFESSLVQCIEEFGGNSQRLCVSVDDLVGRRRCQQIDPLEVHARGAETPDTGSEVFVPLFR